MRSKSVFTFLFFLLLFNIFTRKAIKFFLSILFENVCSKELLLCSRFFKIFFFRKFYSQKIVFFFSCELLVTWIQSHCMLFKWKLDEQILVAYTILNWKKNFHISCVSASRWINRSHEQRFFKTTINCFLMKQFQWHELCDAFDSIYMRKAIRNACT